ncbi:uncharacterized protein [Dysidea avara]|uniref:uncharacterized protein n=1 Tax=Dysidea avara TaxID=196820 RepID=UPI00332EEBB9
MNAKFERLEKEVADGQEETAHLIVRKIQQKEPEPTFRRKGNERQFAFNQSVVDAIKSAASMLDKLKPEQPQAASVLKNAREQLQEGVHAIAAQQKLIRLADSSDCGWGAVEEYLKEEIATDEKDAKKWSDAEKRTMEQRRRLKRTVSERESPPQPVSQGFAGPFPVVGTGPACGMPPPPVFGPPPHPQPPMFMKPTGPPGPPTRVPGPCFHCLQMGHLRAQCPARFRGGRP